MALDLESLLPHLAASQVMEQHQGETPDDPVVRTGRSRSTGKRVGLTKSGRLIPLEEEEASPAGKVARVVGQVTDPLKISQFPFLPLGKALLPKPEMQLAVAGAGIGESVPVPFASTFLGGLGGAAGRSIELARQSPSGQLPEGAGRDVAMAGGINTLMGLVPGALKLGKGLVRTSQAVPMGRELGVLGGTRVSEELSAPRLAFVNHVRQQLAESPVRSGEQLGEKLTGLQAQFPERQPILGAHFRQSLGQIQQLLGQNPALTQAMLKSADDLGHRDLLVGLLPELQLSPERMVSQSGQATVALPRDIALKGRIVQALREQGQLTGEIRPESVTLDQVQKFKQVLGDVFSKKMGKFGAKMTKTELDALDAYMEVRGAELATHPELKQEFARHREILQQFRQVKDILSDPDALEQAMKGRFGGTAASQEAVKGLLADRPETMLQVRRFADAAELEQTHRQLLRRTLGYSAMIPFYLAMSQVRHEIFRRR